MMKTMMWACLMAGLATGAQAMSPAAAADHGEAVAAAAATGGLPQLLSLYEAARTANLAQFQQSLAQLPSLASVGAAEFASEASPQARMGLLQAMIWPSDALLMDGDHWVDRGIDNTALRQRFRQERGLREQMLVLALNQGLSPIAAAEETPLALALAAGSPKMVDALLAAGADPRQQNDVGQAPLTVLFSERFERLLLAPLAQDYVTAAERSDMVLALIKAGAPRPYPQRSMAEWQKKPLYERDLTWLQIWRDTAGSEVVDALLALGALPDAIADQRPLNHAVVYGRLDGVQRLVTLGAATEKFMLEPETLLAVLVTDAKVTRETLRYAAQASGEALADVCVLNGYALMGLSHQPQRISMLQQEGMRFGQTCAQGKLPMLMNWLTALSLHATEPPLLGASEDKMVALLQAGMAEGLNIDMAVMSTRDIGLVFQSLELPPIVEPVTDAHWTLTQLATAAGRDDVLRVLARSKGQALPAAKLQPEPFKAPSMNAAERAFAQERVGRYRLAFVMETAAELLLKPDGTFEYAMSAGAYDGYSKGVWWAEGRNISIQSEANPPYSAFTLAQASPGRLNSSIQVSITSGNDYLFDQLRLSIGTSKKQIVLDTPSRLHEDDAGKTTGVYEVALDGPVVGMAFAARDINRGRWVTVPEAAVQGQRQLVFAFKAQPESQPLRLLLSYEKEALSHQTEGGRTWYFVKD